MLYVRDVSDTVEGDCGACIAYVRLAKPGEIGGMAAYPGPYTLLGGV
jgi:hypothetical protein